MDGDEVVRGAGFEAADLELELAVFFAQLGGLVGGVLVAGLGKVQVGADEFDLVLCRGGFFDGFADGDFALGGDGLIWVVGRLGEFAEFAL